LTWSISCRTASTASTAFSLLAGASMSEVVGFFCLSEIFDRFFHLNVNAVPDPWPNVFSHRCKRLRLWEGTKFPPKDASVPRSITFQRTASQCCLKWLAARLVCVGSKLAVIATMTECHTVSAQQSQHWQHSVTTERGGNTLGAATPHFWCATVTTATTLSGVTAERGGNTSTVALVADSFAVHRPTQPAQQRQWRIQPKMHHVFFDVLARPPTRSRLVRAA